MPPCIWRESFGVAKHELIFYAERRMDPIAVDNVMAVRY
jgi:hypothetical protein